MPDSRNEGPKPEALIAKKTLQILSALATVSFLASCKSEPVAKKLDTVVEPVPVSVPEKPNKKIEIILRATVEKEGILQTMQDKLDKINEGREDSEDKARLPDNYEIVVRDENGNIRFGATKSVLKFSADGIVLPEAFIVYPNDVIEVVRKGQMKEVLKSDGNNPLMLTATSLNKMTDERKVNITGDSLGIFSVSCIQEGWIDPNKEIGEKEREWRATVTVADNKSGEQAEYSGANSCVRAYGEAVEAFMKAAVEKAGIGPDN